MDQDKNNFQYAKELKAIAKGNKKSFQTLYNQEASWMLTFAFKVLRNYKLAEDAVVETFKIIWNNAQYYEESLNHPRGWIYTIFRFHLQNTIRKNYQALKESKKEPDALMSEICTNLYAGVNQFVEPGSFYQIFEELPEETQKTLITSYFSGRSLADTATLLSMPLGRLKENIQMGLRYLTQKRSTLQDIKHDHTVFIGEFVLGGLTEAEQNKVHTLLNEDPIAEKLTFVWEEEFLHFLNQLILEKAPDNLWVRIKQATLPEKDSSIDTNELNDELALTENAEQSNKLLFRLKKFWISRNFWRTFSFCLLGLVAALLVFHPFENPIRYTATLTSTTPPNQAAFLLRGQNEAHIIPIIKQDLGETLRLQLWQRDSQGLTKAIAPIYGNKETKLPSDIELNPGDILLISVEPANTQKPENITGQILYEGFVVKF